MTSYPINGVDTSWPQGNFHAGPGDEFVAVGASSADGGSLFIQDTYAEQVDNARADGKAVLHYFFNGAVDPDACARFFVANLHDYRPGDGLVLDVEPSAGGKYPAWTPALSRVFVSTVRSLVGPVKHGIYGDESRMTVPGWGAVERDLDCWLWLAWPGSEAGIRIGEWSHLSIWQYTIAGGVDQDRAIAPIGQILGAVVVPTEAPKPKEIITMWYIEAENNAAGDYGEWLVGPNYKHHLGKEEASQVKPIYQKKDAVIDFGTGDAARRAFDLFVAVHTVPTAQ